MKKIKKSQVENAILEMVKYAQELDIDFEEFNKSRREFQTFKDFLYAKKLKRTVDELIASAEESREYLIDSVVYVQDSEPAIVTNGLLLEYEQYRKIPKTNLTYRFDPGNTNTRTIDHIHVYLKNNQLYAINRDGSPHDGSKAQLSKKEIKFLKTIGFTPPSDGLLEWITLDPSISYYGLKLELLRS